MNKPIAIAAIILLAGCFAAKKTVPTQEEVNQMQGKYPGYTLVEMQQGKALFETHCNTCHPLKNPSSHSEEDWNGIVPEMVGKVNKKEKTSFGTKEEQLILKYIITVKTTAVK